MGRPADPESHAIELAQRGLPGRLAHPAIVLEALAEPGPDLQRDLFYGPLVGRAEMPLEVEPAKSRAHHPIEESDHAIFGPVPGLLTA